MPHLNNKFKNRTVLLGMIFLSCVHQAQSAITITISGERTSTTALVTLSGSIVLPDYSGRDERLFIGLVLPNPSNPSRLFEFGGNSDGGAVTSSQFALEDSFPPAIFSAASTASFEITDSSNGGAILVSDGINFFSYGVDGRFFLFLSNDQGVPELTSDVDAGDILTVQGSFEHWLGFNNWDDSEDEFVGEVDQFSDRFNLGKHYGSYNGQQFIVNVVPEPSVSFLGAIALGCLLGRRNR